MMICERIYHAVSLILFLLNQTALFASALLLRHYYYCPMILVAIAAANLGVNCVSAKWTIADRAKSGRVHSIFIHCMLLALPWRYVRLARCSQEPGSAGRVGTVEVCLLRLLHGAVASLPTVCLHLHAVLDQEMSISAIHLVCIGIHLVDLGWAAASVSRKTSRARPDRMILSWPGVITQTCWRLGTVSSRLIVLVAFTVSYDLLIVAVVFLQWLLMMVIHLMLFSSNEADSASKCRPQQLLATCAVSFVCIIDYFSFSDRNTSKLAVYYVLRFVENCFLLGLWHQSLAWHKSELMVPVTAVALGGYCFGILSLLTYHSCFSSNRLMADLSAAPQNGFVCRLPFQMRHKLPSKFNVLDSSQHRPDNSFVKFGVVDNKCAELETRF
uniref:XK-related protein n=1 Tax=Plectus sambesii TaxID=2011161 RepID=A0A914VWU8_9BILA